MTVKSFNDNFGSIFLGDDHSEEFWKYNYKALRDFKPDFLLLEVIGVHRYYNAVDRCRAMDTSVYMSNSMNMGYNSDAFNLGNDLDVPMIGIDTWVEPYIYDDGFSVEEVMSDPEKLYISHGIRESRMVEVVKEFIGCGKILLIVGAEHLREDSELYRYASGVGEVKFFKL